MRSWLIAGLLLSAMVALGFVAERLYEQDEWGMRTAMSRRFPAQYEKQNLTGQKLDGAWLPYANVRGAILRDVLIRDVNAQHADFSGADFTEAGVGGKELRAVPRA